MCRLSLVGASGGYSLLRCTGFSLQWLLSLWSTGFRCMGFSSCGLWALECRLSSFGLRALQHRLSSCGAQAQLLHGMWDLPGPGIKPVSPALAGGFLTIMPPGKSQSNHFSNGCLLIVPGGWLPSQLLFFFFNYYFYLFIYLFGCVGSSFLCEGFL